MCRQLVECDITRQETIRIDTRADVSEIQVPIVCIDGKVFPDFIGSASTQVPSKIGFVFVTESIGRSIWIVASIFMQANMCETNTTADIRR